MKKFLSTIALAMIAVCCSAATGGYIYADDTTMGKDGSVVLSVKMNNDVPMTGFQFDMELPAGVSIEKDGEFLVIDLSTERTTARKTDYFNSAIQSDGSVRVMCSSTKSYTFTGTDGEVATISLKGSAASSGVIKFKNIVLSDANGKTYKTSETTCNLLSSFAHDKCDAPTITFANGKLSFSSGTAGAEYHYTVAPKQAQYEGTTKGEIDFSTMATFDVSVYAMALDHANSDIVTKTISATLAETGGGGSVRILKGDMNGDGKITMADANEVANTYLGKKTVEYIRVAGDAADNSSIAGTWYETKTKNISFNADGTTDYTTCSRYGYYPSLNAIVFFDKDGKLLSFRNILKLTEQELSIDNQGATVTYNRTRPVTKVTSITLSKVKLNLTLNGYEMLTATVLPEDADDKSYTWKSSDESVVMIIGDGRLIPLKLGTCTITCSANDGSGVKATCTVTVSNNTDTHEAVDLGLSVKWATCNVGASKPEEYGDYFAWGETEGYNSSKKSFSWDTYKWCNGSSTTMTKYCTSSSFGTVDNKKVLDKSDDAAYVNWGGSWRMPTKAEQDELRNTSNCTWTWTTMNGVSGYKVVSKKNGNSIFLPAAGHRYNSSLYNAGSYGNYWSSSLDESYSSSACYLYFYSGYVGWRGSDRCGGQSVRAVCQ